MCVNPNGHSYIPVETRTVSIDQTGQSTVTYVDELMCIYCRDFQRINRKTETVQHSNDQKPV
jgi:hypothetical protein